MKQRIVGAILLTLLAVIFVPMVLDEEAQTDVRIVEFDLPEQPESLRFTMVDLTEDPVADMPQPSAVITPPESAPRAAARQPEKAPPPPAEPAEKRADPPAEPPARTQPSAPPPVQTSDTSDAKPALVTGDWAVQAASFMERSNAEALQADLKRKGYQAYLQTGQTPSGRPVYRVRLGPMADRAGAEAVRRRLQQTDGLNGLVVQRDDA